jgi:hypothetical protein
VHTRCSTKCFARMPSRAEPCDAPNRLPVHRASCQHPRCTSPAPNRRSRAPFSPHHPNPSPSPLSFSCLLSLCRHSSCRVSPSSATVAGVASPEVAAALLGRRTPSHAKPLRCVACAQAEPSKSERKKKPSRAEPACASQRRRRRRSLAGVRRHRPRPPVASPRPAAAARRRAAPSRVEQEREEEEGDPSR